MYVLYLYFLQGEINQNRNRWKSESFECRMKILGTRLICCDLLNIEETLLFLLDSCKIKKKLELITTIIWNLIKFEQFIWYLSKRWKTRSLQAEGAARNACFVTIKKKLPLDSRYSVFPCPDSTVRELAFWHVSRKLWIWSYLFHISCTDLNKASDTISVTWKLFDSSLWL